MSAPEIVQLPEERHASASDSEAPQVRDTEQEAAGRAESIRQGMGELADLMKTALDRADHLALGYESWAEYIVGEFSEARIPARRELVALMSAQGMSERQIATATGLDKSAVHRDRTASPVSGAAQLRADERLRVAAARATSEERRVKLAWDRDVTDEDEIAEMTGVSVKRVRKIIRSTAAKRFDAQCKADGQLAASNLFGIELPPAPDDVGPDPQAAVQKMEPPAVTDARMNPQIQHLTAEVANARAEADALRRRTAQLTATLHRNKLLVPGEPGLHSADCQLCAAMDTTPTPEQAEVVERNAAAWWASRDKNEVTAMSFYLAMDLIGRIPQEGLHFVPSGARPYRSGSADEVA